MKKMAITLTSPDSIFLPEMVVVEIKDILSNLSQLDTHLFKTTQQSLAHDLNSFVSAFDNEPDKPSSTTSVSTEDLALAFIQLNSCQTHLDLAKKQKSNWDDLNKELNDMQQTVGEIRNVIKLREQREAKTLSPFEEEKKAFMDQLQQQRKAYQQDLQRQYDKMEENHAKKTRESIYRNLVGSNAWLNG